MQATDGGDPAAAVVASPRGLAVLSALCREDLDVEMTAWFRVCWGEPEQDDRLLAR